jgi:hypothetical protein
LYGLLYSRCSGDYFWKWDGKEEIDEEVVEEKQ